MPCYLFVKIGSMYCPSSDLWDSIEYIFAAVRKSNFELQPLVTS